MRHIDFTDGCRAWRFASTFTFVLGSARTKVRAKHGGGRTAVPAVISKSFGSNGRTGRTIGARLKRFPHAAENYVGRSNSHLRIRRDQIISQASIIHTFFRNQLQRPAGLIT